MRNKCTSLMDRNKLMLMHYYKLDDYIDIAIV